MQRFPHMDRGSKEGQDHFDEHNNEITLENVHLLCNLSTYTMEDGVFLNFF